MKDLFELCGECRHLSDSEVVYQLTNNRETSKRVNEMLLRGVYLAPSQFEAMFVSSAHTQDDLEATVKAAEESIAALGN